VNSFTGLHCSLDVNKDKMTPSAAVPQRVNSFMQSLLQKVSFCLCLCLMNNEDKMIFSAAVTA